MSSIDIIVASFEKEIAELKAHIEQSNSILLRILDNVIRDINDPESVLIACHLERAPAQCLAEHDAKVIEDAVKGYLAENDEIATATCIYFLNLASEMKQ